MLTSSYLRGRYHVGESLVPSVRTYMRFIDAEEKLVNHGFKRKVRIKSVFRLFASSHSASSLEQLSSLIRLNGKDVRHSIYSPPRKFHSNQFSIFQTQIS